MSTHTLSRGQGEANARLIAAAPDLLAALREIIACCDERASFDGDAAMKRWCAAISETARAAIQKAEGCCKYHRSGGDMTLSCGGDIAKAEETS